MQKQQHPRTWAIIGVAMKVHTQLGSSFLERVYQDTLELEFIAQKIPYVREQSLPVFYKGQQLQGTYCADFICCGNIIVESKVIKALTEIEHAQIINYLKVAKHPLGLLFNFGSLSLQYQRFISSKNLRNLRLPLKKGRST